jgi:hypothetical protein
VSHLTPMPQLPHLYTKENTNHCLQELVEGSACSIGKGILPTPNSTGPGVLRHIPVQAFHEEQAGP